MTINLLIELLNLSTVMKQRIYTLTLLLMAFALGAMAQLRLPAIISDHMVIQRGEPVHVWGWAAPGQKVTATLAGHKATVRTGKDGRWSLYLPAISAAGPHTLTVSAGKESLSVTDILAGEVWMTSGQSNMDFRLRSIDRADDEISHATNASIRLFEINHALASRPADDVSGHWAVTTPEAADCFTAVGYLFAKELNAALGCPVGIVNASWGGTQIESWMTMGSIDRFPKYTQLMEQLRSDAFRANELRGLANDARFEREVAADRGEAAGWYAPSYDKSHWQPLAMPGLWADAPLARMDGVVWTTAKFTVPDSLAGREALLSLGFIDDADVTWVNGHRVGATRGYAVKRRYQIPAGVLHAGDNELTVKIVDDHDGGGCYGSASLFYVQVGSRRLSILNHPWSYCVSVEKDNSGFRSYFSNDFPSRIYNGMVAPVAPYPVKGIVWYQGEANTERPGEYRDLFPAMIDGWRQARQRPELPFYWVQLPNFIATPKNDLAGLRDAQTSALSLAHTGQAVTIDVGNPTDEHPLDKHTVARRLALHALHNDYGHSDLVCQSPRVTGVTRQGDGTILVTFSHVAQGLQCHDRYGYLCGFAVIDAQGKRHCVKAEIAGTDSVRLLTTPNLAVTTVTYGWENNPEDANLFGSTGLPATPFMMKVGQGK